MKTCYLCNVPFYKSDTWSPTKLGKEPRLHCTRKCYFMYRIAYQSDPTLRIEHAIRRAEEQLALPQAWGNKTALKKRIKEFKAALKRLKTKAA